jgi:hypothetical protein
MAKTEDIEGRLAAYIDGELDANQRAEIEKHLAEHPKHRALIAELMAQKDLVKSLPRQAAPADLAEAFTAQLERAVLLGDVDSQVSHPPMRIGFFQQFRAVAAVLMLTVGLAALIYALLPRREGRSALVDLRELPMPPEAAVTLERSFTPEPPAVADARGRELRDEAIAPAAEALRLDNPSVVTAAPAVVSAPVEEDATPAPAPPAPTAVAAAAPASTDARLIVTPSAESQVFDNGGTSGDAIFRQMVADQQGQGPIANSEVVIRTADVAVANRQVTEYLDSNQIKWEMQPMPGPLGLAMSQQGLSSRFQAQTFEVKDAGTGIAGGAGGGARGGRGGSGPSTQNQAENPWLLSNNRLAGAAGDNVLPTEEAVQSQRIVAQVPRRQATEVVSQLNQFKSGGTPSQTIPLVSRTNTIALAPGFNELASSPLPSNPPGATVTGLRELASPGAENNAPAAPMTPTTFPSGLYLLPTDPFSFFSASHQPALDLTTPTTQPGETGAGAVIDRIAGVAPSATEELVDVVIVIEPQPAAAVPMTQPATLPAP